jgi:hypothetical protein
LAKTAGESGVGSATRALSLRKQAVVIDGRQIDFATLKLAEGGALSALGGSSRLGIVQPVKSSAAASSGLANNRAKRRALAANRRKSLVNCDPIRNISIMQSKLEMVRLKRTGLLAQKLRNVHHVHQRQRILN